jgi:VWFA-related protein
MFELEARNPRMAMPGRSCGRVAFLILLLATLAAAAQDPGAAASQPTVIRTEVRQVLVPVVVTDRHGHHVPGLKASDFQVLEDGQPQNIVALGTQNGAPMPVSIDPGAAAAAGSSAGAPGSGAAVAPANPNTPGMSYMILVDTLHSSSASFAHVREALGKFFEKEPAMDAQYEVVALGRELHMVQNSTRDIAVAMAAVRAKSFSNLILDSEARNLAEAADQITALMREYCVACACTGAGTTRDGPGCPSAKARVEGFLNNFGERMFLLNETFLRELNEIVKAVANLPASRTILFISDGFNRFPGRELYGAIAGYGPLTLTFNPRDTQPELEAVLKLATKSDVKFYTFDSRGLYTVNLAPGSGFDTGSSSRKTSMQVDGGASRGGAESPNLAAGVPEAVTSQALSAARESTDVLSEFARQTGGLFFENNNDLLKELRQAVADGREYYVLSYVPENKTTDGTYRKIVVTVKDPKLRVKAKAGYWATGS